MSQAQQAHAEAGAFGNAAVTTLPARFARADATKRFGVKPFYPHPTFGFAARPRALIAMAEQVLQLDDPERRELAEQLLTEVRRIPT